MTHANAPLTPLGRRRLAELIVDEGWPVRRAAERFQFSPATAAKWAARYRAGRADDGSVLAAAQLSRAMRSRLERRIVKLRYCRRWGPHRISYHLGVPRSTVGRVLARYRMPLLAHIDQATGLPVRKPKPVRYEAAAPGDLVHVDIKKLGRIPDGGGWRVFGRGLRTGPSSAALPRDRAARAGASLRAATSTSTTPSTTTPGWPTPNSCPTNARRPPQAFWDRARAFFADAGITVQAVMTDNGACYRSHDFAKRSARNQAPPHPPLPAPDQRQGRAVQPQP